MGKTEHQRRVIIASGSPEAKHSLNQAILKRHREYARLSNPTSKKTEKAKRNEKFSKSAEQKFIAEYPIMDLNNKVRYLELCRQRIKQGNASDEEYRYVAQHRDNFSKEREAIRLGIAVFPFELPKA